MSAALALQGITRRFGSLLALDDVFFTAASGSVHALLGENGAGKTTLMRVAFGLVRADSGHVEVSGKRVDIQSPRDALDAGIGMVHQQFSLVKAMTVAENVALGAEGHIRLDEVAGRIHDIGARTGLLLDPARRVESLTAGERQKLEIVRMLARDARILILDEPTAVLATRDTGELFAQLRSFADSGGTVVLITHKLGDALAHADQVTVLRRGRVSLVSPVTSASQTSLVTAMLGAPPPSESRSAETPRSYDVVARLDETTVRDKRDLVRGPWSVEIRRGEILGIAALDGAASVLLRLLAGRIAPLTGRVLVPERIGFVPEDRLGEGLIPGMSLLENFALAGSGLRRGLVDWDTMRSPVAATLDEFSVHANGPEAEAATLSGGNQQRFILGRELHDAPELLVLENPTQGLDVNAAAGVRSRIRSAAGTGSSVVVYSSDLDELCALSHRIIVAHSSGLAEATANRVEVGRLLVESGAGQGSHV